jgi:transposase
MLQPLCRRSWAARGSPPQLAAWDRHDRLTAIAALVLPPDEREPKLFFRLQRHNAHSEDFLHFLLELRYELATPMSVVWDRLSAHRRCERVFRECDCPWARFHYLPAYCPELNPVEHLWSTAKWGSLANWPAADLESLSTRLTSELRRQRRKKKMLRGHVHWAGVKAA